VRSSYLILYVEDDPDTRELVALVLGQESHQVMLAKSMDEALLLARLMRFDLYILDNWMPGGSGIELCRRLREFDPVTPVLFYSGAAHDVDKIEALATGAQAYLTKPAHNEDLVEVVSRLISQSEPIAHRHQVPDRVVPAKAIRHAWSGPGSARH
jgi:two-component system OmpR family response regulator